ncbi:hypothetical protein ACFWN2_35045 [Lentzea sp. NPDC058436]|uniref:hypothetical protein n=1 Tax=Lentzea sp. NPDC058436 TaxID=3346499 RepID=UPI0036555209
MWIWISAAAFVVVLLLGAWFSWQTIRDRTGGFPFPDGYDHDYNDRHRGDGGGG